MCFGWFDPAIGNIFNGQKCAIVRDRVTGTRYEVRASYLVGADGLHSSVREALGIARTGPGVLEDRMSVLFRTALDATVRGRRFTACVVDDIHATLVPRAGGLWRMTVLEPMVEGLEPGSDRVVVRYWGSAR